MKKHQRNARRAEIRRKQKARNRLNGATPPQPAPIAVKPVPAPEQPNAPKPSWLMVAIGYILRFFRLDGLNYGLPDLEVEEDQPLRMWTCRILNHKPGLFILKFNGMENYQRNCQRCGAMVLE
jgi:hypothetical protein